MKVAQYKGRLRAGRPVEVAKPFRIEGRRVGQHVCAARVRRQFSRHVRNAAPLGDDFGEGDTVHGFGLGLPYAGFEPRGRWRNQPCAGFAGRHVGNRYLNRITARVAAGRLEIEAEENGPASALRSWRARLGRKFLRLLFFEVGKGEFPGGKNPLEHSAKARARVIIRVDRAYPVLRLGL